MAKITNVGVTTITQYGGCNSFVDCKNIIALFQKSILSTPIKVSLKKIPIKIAPIASKDDGNNITKGDSWTSFKLIFLLWYLPWKVLKINLQEYIAVSRAVKIPTEAERFPNIPPFKYANSIIASLE